MAQATITRICSHPFGFGAAGGAPPCPCCPPPPFCVGCCPCCWGRVFIHSWYGSRLLGRFLGFGGAPDPGCCPPSSCSGDAACWSPAFVGRCELIAARLLCISSVSPNQDTSAEAQRGSTAGTVGRGSSCRGRGARQYISASGASSRQRALGLLSGEETSGPQSPRPCT